MNKLPGKLNLLRRNSGMSQSEIAQKLLVPVSEYMNWENGNSIPSIEQLKVIADTFHVDVSALIDNTVAFVAPQPVEKPVETEKSATIPFVSNGGINATQELGNTLGDTVVAGNMSGIEQGDTVDGGTKVMDTNAFSFDDEEDEEDEEEETRPKKTVKVKHASPFQNKKTWYILGGCGVALVVILAVVLLVNGLGGGSLNALSDVNRLSLGSRYSIFIENSGSIKARGQGYNSTALSGSVQVSTYSDWSLGLKEDGTVSSTNTSIDTSDWTDVKMIAAGYDHAAAVKEDGTVLCTGNSSACEVDGWENVSSIYAGNGVTVALTEDGSFLSSGGVNIPTSAAGVKGVAISDGGVYYITTNGMVSGISLNGSTIPSTSNLNNISAIAAGSDFVAGLGKDGSVKVSTTNADLSKAVESWKNVRYIAANGNTLIGMTSNGQMYGTGDNQYGQYENTAGTEATPSASADTKLSSVQNITLSETPDNVQIKWDAVEHADYYEVTVEPGGIKNNSQSNSISIRAEELEDGTSYTITVTAKANNTDEYQDSDPSTVNYQYTRKQTQLAVPSEITATADSGGSWIISWLPVDNATSYDVYINGTYVAGSTGLPNATVSKSLFDLQDGVTYNVAVVAKSSDDKYSDSENQSVALVYNELRYGVTLNYSDGETETVELKAGTYNLRDIVTRYTADQIVDQTITVSQNMTVDVQLITSESPDSGTTEG